MLSRQSSGNLWSLFGADLNGLPQATLGHFPRHRLIPALFRNTPATSVFSISRSISSARAMFVASTETAAVTETASTKLSPFLSSSWQHLSFLHQIDEFMVGYCFPPGTGHFSVYVLPRRHVRPRARHRPSCPCYPYRLDAAPPSRSSSFHDEHGLFPAGPESASPSHRACP